MKRQNLHRDQNGLAHLLLIGMAAFVIVVVGLVAWRVSDSHKKSNVALINPASTQLKAKSGTSSPASSTVAGATSQPTPKSSGSSSTGIGKSSPVNTTPSSTPASPPPSTPSPVIVIPGGYTNLGTVSAANLYNVKVPPAGNQQPTMTLYACIHSVGLNTDTIKTLGVLSYPIPQSASSAWYVDVNLSSSASSDVPVSSKTVNYSYQINSWQNVGAPSGDVNESSAITTDSLNPGVITDYYVWASGSYGGQLLQSAASHPNVTGLAACNS